MNSTRAMILAVVTLVVLAQQGFAIDPPDFPGDFRSGATGNWDNSNTWQEWTGTSWDNTANVPGQNDRATIQATHTVTITSLTTDRIRTLIMKDGATAGALQINGAGSLTIYHALEMENNGSGAETTISLAATGVSTARLTAKSDITIAGTVNVTGDGVNQITSDTAGDVVTVSASGLLMTRGGDLTVTSADVVMNGTVTPSANETITFSGGINSGSSGNWELSAAGSTIRINTTSGVNIVSSAGHILISNGTLDIDKSFTFAGGLKQTGGTIDVAAGATFKATGRYFD